GTKTPDESVVNPADERGVLRYSVQLRAATDRDQPLVHVDRGRPGQPAALEPRRADHRPAHPADDWRDERPDLEPALGTPKAVLPNRRARLLDRPVSLPVRHGALDGRPAAVAPGRV